MSIASDLKQINAWLGKKEPRKRKTDRSFNERKAANKKKRMAVNRTVEWKARNREKANAQVARWRERNRESYCSYQRVLMQSRKG